MTVKNVIQDPDALTLTLVGEFAAARERVWRVWAEPELLGRWWGPPGWPATFLTYEFRLGGKAHYYMEGPEQQRHYGGWAFTALDAGRALAFDDHFADEAGNANTDLPGTTCRVTLEQTGGVTTMTLVSVFASLAQMEELAKMGMVEGMRAAMGQIDALL